MFNVRRSLANRQNLDRSRRFLGPSGSSLFGGAIPNISFRNLWTSAKSLTSHWLKHKAEFSNLKNEGAYEKAGESLETRAAVQSKVRKDGTTVRYDPNTGEFGAYRKDGRQKTHFKPNAGQAYYDKQN